jgi:hypothetical protein
VKIDITVHPAGPLLDGRADGALAQWQESTSKAIADEGMERLGKVPMNKSGRSKGNFRASLHEVRQSRAAVTIPGPMIRGATWAPWLEGTSRRNRSTRFRGYHLFRDTARELDGLAEQIGERELAKVIADMGGTP